MKILIASPLLVLLAAACAHRAQPVAAHASPGVPAPLPRVEASAYDTAGQVELPEVEATELPGLHNVFRLSDTIVSGGEPENEQALKAIADMGVRTVLTVDGKMPDHELAAKYGLRYVHVPIRYTGLEHDQLLAIAKTFREMEGPFYVHCFHGQHRGPAAAAVGRVVLDGASRQQAAAEMRQYCGTSKKYEGLYSAITFEDIPDEAATKAYVFDFPAAHEIGGLRHGMIELTRSWDVVEALADRDWVVDPDHPDANARNEAEKALEIFEQSLELDETATQPDDFREMFETSVAETRKLVALLRDYGNGDAAAGEKAIETTHLIGATCSACHSKYRNN